MAYLTIPNSLTTATTVTADPLEGNYQAVVTGLMCGNVDVKVNQFTGKALTVSGNVSCTSFSYTGTDRGTRHLFVLGEFQAKTFGDQGDGYMGHFGNTTTGTETKHFSLPHSGSVTGYSFYYYPTSGAAGTATVALICSGTTFASAEFDLNGSTQTIYSVITRGVYSFVSQAGVAMYYTEITPANSEGYMGITMEVVFE